MGLGDLGMVGLISLGLCCSGFSWMLEGPTHEKTVPQAPSPAGDHLRTALQGNSFLCTLKRADKNRRLSGNSATGKHPKKLR